MDNSNRLVEHSVDAQLSENQSQKLTNWAKEPDVRQLKMDFEIAKQAHDAQMLKIGKWNDLMAVKGDAAPKKVKGRSSVQPKLIRRQAEWRYSALTEPFLSSSKLFNVKPTSFEDAEGARQNELILNWQFRTKLNRVKFIDDFVRAIVDEGTGIVQVGWKRCTIKVKEKVPVFTHYALTTDEQLQTFKEALDLRAQDKRHFEEKADPALKASLDYYDEKGQATTAMQTGETEVEVEKPIENHPVLQVLNPHNFFLDPSCNGEIEKALFAAVSFETNKAELIKYPNRYKNLDQVNWEGSTPLTQPDHHTQTPDTFQFSDALRKRVVAYEYWGFYDIHGKGELTPIVCTWIGNVMIRMEENPFPDKKLPFVLVPYLPVKREIYGEPDAELLEDNQKILGAVMRGMIDLLGRSANGQKGFAKGMLDPLNRRKYENGQDYEFNPNLAPANGMMEHKYPELPQSALVMANLQNQEAEALTGVKAFSGGVSGDAYGDVAAGIRGALDAASKREMAILRRIAKGMVEIAAKILSMNQVFLSKREVVRVTNEEFVEVDRDDLQGNYDLEADISTAEVDNQKAQDLAFMLQTIGNGMDISITLMILAEIADLKRMPDLAKKLRTFKPTLSPEQQQLHELALEKAKLEIEELKSQIELNRAKAKQAEATADKANLDYVEQETGTAHARDMAKQAGQARGNQDLAVTKALLDKRKNADGSETKPDVEAAVGWNQVSGHLADPHPATGGVGGFTPPPVNADVAPLQPQLAPLDPNAIPQQEQPQPPMIAVGKSYGGEVGEGESELEDKKSDVDNAPQVGGTEKSGMSGSYEDTD
jgi:hypothetical protein